MDSATFRRSFQSAVHLAKQRIIRNFSVKIKIDSHKRIAILEIYEVQIQYPLHYLSLRWIHRSQRLLVY